MRLFGSGSRDGQYELLPTNSSSSSASYIRRLTFIPSSARRRAFFLLCGVGITFLIGVLVVTKPTSVKVAWSNISNSDSGIVKPPTFDRFYELERHYPQHDPSLPPPEGENGRYVWVSNQHWGMFLFLSLRIRTSFPLRCHLIPCILILMYLFAHSSYRFGMEQHFPKSVSLFQNQVTKEL